MAIKLLENAGIENTGIGASALNNLITGNKSGIVGNYLNECAFTATGNTIIIDKGLLIICGRQVEIDAIESITLSSYPSEDVRYQIVIELIREESGEVTASIFARQPSTLIQENLMKDGFVYQFELGRVTHKKTGQVAEVLRTADILYGQSGAVADIEVGEVTTAMVDTNIPAEVNINKVLDDGKTKLNFDFLLPKPYDENVTDLVSAVTTTGNPVNIQNTNDGFVDKVKITNDTASAISSPLTGKSIGKNLINIENAINMGGGTDLLVLTKNIPSGTLTLTAQIGAYGIYFDNRLNLETNTSYTIKCVSSWSEAKPIQWGIRIYNVAENSYSAHSRSDTLTFNTGDYTQYRFMYYIGAPTTQAVTVTLSQIQLELGSTATDYEPYTATAFSIPLKNTSGTVLDLNPADVIEIIDGKYHLNSTELHDESQDALRAIPTKAGQTNLIGDQPFTFDVTEFQLGLESIDAMLTLPDGTRVNVITKDRMVFISSGEYKGKTLDYVLQELKNEIDGKQNTLTFDDTPTSGSNNPVTSDGIKTALDSKANLAELAEVKTLIFENTSGWFNDSEYAAVFTHTDSLLGKVLMVEWSQTTGDYHRYSVGKADEIGFNHAIIRLQQIATFAPPYMSDRFISLKIQEDSVNTLRAEHRIDVYVFPGEGGIVKDSEQFSSLYIYRVWELNL